jgi:hypothetical protein
MLTGTTPFSAERLRSAAWGQLQSIIRDEDPPIPSTRVSTLKDELDILARSRNVEPKRLSAELKGELDWIVMKAMEKDRTRRYPTTTALATDLDRYLNDEPVTAGPPSAVYRWKKYARRYRGAMIAAGTVVAAMLLGIIATTYTMFWALAERDKAIAEHRHAVMAEQRAIEEAERAKRYSSMAGNMLMNTDQINRSKEEWEHDLDTLRSQLSPEGGQFQDEESSTTKESGEMIKKLYPRAREVLGLKDMNFFGVCNSYLQYRMLVEKAEPTELVAAFDDLMTCLRNLYGESHVITKEVMLEYGIVVMMAGQREKADTILRRFFELAGDEEDASMTMKMRLQFGKKAIEELDVPPEELSDSLKQVLEWHRKHVGDQVVPTIF